MPFEYTQRVLQDRLQLLSLFPESEFISKRINELNYAIGEISNWSDDNGGDE